MLAKVTDSPSLYETDVGHMNHGPKSLFCGRGVFLRRSGEPIGGDSILPASSVCERADDHSLRGERGVQETEVAANGLILIQ